MTDTPRTTLDITHRLSQMLVGKTGEAGGGGGGGGDVIVVC